jgi:hypothetical protein
MLIDDKLQQLQNFTPALHDFLLGDRSLEQLITLAEAEKIKTALSVLKNDVHTSPARQQELLSNTWTIYDRMKSPTPEEFLTPAWIGPLATELSPHVRKIFLEYWNPTAKYNSLILASAIGTYKSTTAVLSNLFITATLWSKRNPKRFYGATQMTSFVQALISFSQDKATQLLVQPFINLLKSSPKFKKITMEEHLDKQQKDNPDRICWTTSSRIGALQFWGDIHYPVASSPQNLLGLNMISATMSEISFFIERGFSPDYIWRIYQDSKYRVSSRFGTNRMATIILDSSPNDLDFSPIDKYIFTGEAQKDPSNYVVTGSSWDIRPDHEEFKEWRKTGETFTVFRGSAGEPPELLETLEAIKKHNPLELINVPIDLKRAFTENLTKSIKDAAGWPAGNPDKLIRDTRFIDRVFKSNLRNFYSYITVPANMEPKHHLWNIVKDKFFVETSEGHFEFYRAPRAERFIHIDQAEVKDHASITMSHMEFDDEVGENVCVHDFTLDIAPSSQRISLDAIRLFPEDLRKLGRINIKVLSFDQYQSRLTQQYLTRKEFDVREVSPDRDIKIYLSYVAWINSGRIKAGPNISLKGNLRSLQEIRTPKGKRKIDHTIGKTVKDDGGDWKLSLMGVNQKDVSDGASASFYTCMMETKGVPRYSWKEPATTGPQKKVKKKDGSIVTRGLTPIEITDAAKRAFLDDVRKRYGLETNEDYQKLS